MRFPTFTRRVEVPAARRIAASAKRREDYVIPAANRCAARRPRVFKGIITARVLIEDVNDDVAVILHHPAARLVALDAQAFFPFGTHERVHFLGKGVDLPTAAAGHEDEEIEDRRDATQVQDEHVLGFVVVADAGALNRLLEGEFVNGLD